MFVGVDNPIPIHEPRPPSYPMHSHRQVNSTLAALQVRLECCNRVFIKLINPSVLKSQCSSWAARSCSKCINWTNWSQQLPNLEFLRGFKECVEDCSELPINILEQLERKRLGRPTVSSLYVFRDCVSNHLNFVTTVWRTLRFPYAIWTWHSCWNFCGFHQS